MGQARYDHNHSYIRVTEKLYRCSVEGCNHSISKTLLLNRKAECPDCAGSFIVDAERLRRAKIICQHCADLKKIGTPVYKEPTGAVLDLLRAVKGVELDNTGTEESD